jgi:tRNA dimethylallyltransferase
MRKPLLIVIVGPTGVGKTAVAIRLARHYGTEVVSADSRQFYKEIPIGTASPSLEEMQGVVHHFIGHLSVSEPMDAGKWAAQAQKTIEVVMQSNDTVICAGGSGLYVNALLSGMDDLPERNEELRKQLEDLFAERGLSSLQDRLRKLDPEYCEIVDMNNHKRLIRAIEVCELSGRKYSELRKGKSPQLPYEVVTIGLNMERKELYRRIDARVDVMIEQGLEEEARSVMGYRDNNALATVGYREMFSYFDGEISRARAIELIKQHSRNYAKRQLTWWRRNVELNWFHPSQVQEIIARCEELRNLPVNH